MVLECPSPLALLSIAAPFGGARGLAHSKMRSRLQRSRLDSGATPFTQQPDPAQNRADQGEVGVAVGHRLCSDLDQADDRDQGADVPEPADGQKRPPPSLIET